MRLFFFILSLSIGIFSHAQNKQALIKSDSLFAKGVELYSQGNYKAAIPLFTESDKIDKAEFDSTSNRRDYSAMWLGSCYYKLGDEEKAKEISSYYYKVAPIDRRQTIQSDSLSALADEAFKQNHYAKALDYYKQCEALETELLGEKHIWRMNTIANEGHCYSALNDSTNAIACFEAHQSACFELYQFNSDAAMNTYFSLGNEYYSHQFEDHYTKALWAYFDAFSLSQELNDSTSYLLSCYCIAQCYFSQAMDANSDVKQKLLESAETFVYFLKNDDPDGRQLKNKVYDELANYYCERTTCLQDSALYQKALEYSQKAIDAYKSTPDIDEITLILLQIIKMDCLISLDKTQEAKDIGESLFASFPTQIQGEETYEFILCRLSNCYRELEDIEKYIFCLKQLHMLYTQLHGQQSEQVSEILYELSQAFNWISQNKEALYYAKAYKDICNPNDNMEMYIRALLNLAQAYLQNKEYEKCLVCTEEIATIVQPNSKTYLDALRIKRIAYTNINSAQALDATIQCAKLMKEMYGEQEPAYRSILYDISNIYYNLGDEFSALKTSEEEMRLNQLYADTLEIIYLKNQLTLVNLYCSYNFAKCVPLYFSLANKLGKNEFITEKLWTYTQWPLEDRISEFLFFCDVSNRILTTYKYMYSTNNEAESEIADSIQAEIGKWCIENILSMERYIEEIMLNDPILHSRLYECLSTFYINLSMKHEALDYTIKALEYAPQLKSEDYSRLLDNLSFLYYEEGRYDEMITPLIESYEMNKSMLINTFKNVPKSVRERYMSSMQSTYNFIIKAAEHTKITQLGEKAYDVNLFLKGLMLNTDIEFRKLIQNSGNDSIRVAYERWQELSQANDKLSSEGQVIDSLLADSLTRIEKEIEYMLIRESKKYGNYVNGYSVTWKDVQKKLKATDIAIEFCTYESQKGEEYAAVLLEEKSKFPIVVHLFSQNQLADIPKTDFYTTTAVSNLIWKPLLDYMKEKKNVYFSPIGELNNIAIEYMPLEDGKNFTEHYSVYRLSSTRELVNSKKSNIQTKAVLYGGLEYEREPGDIENLKAELKKETSLVAFRDIPQLDSLTLRKGISFLKGSEHEVQAIDTLLREKKVPVVLMNGMNGTEESFKRLSGKSISLLHIATHGFYSPLTGNYTAQRNFEEQALSRTGLLLSGAATILEMKEKLPEDIEDGILTAKELAHLDLSDLNLVVLSACQTGLGEITGDGVFGLQRGFKKAGANTLLMSLWKVDDTATQPLMTQFYKNLLAGKSKFESLRDAQKYVRDYEVEIDITTGKRWKSEARQKEEKNKEATPKDIRKIKKYKDPFYWAAFILLDAMD